MGLQPLRPFDPAVPDRAHLREQVTAELDKTSEFDLTDEKYAQLARDAVDATCDLLGIA